MNLKNPLGLAGAIAVIFQMIPSSSWAQKQGEIFRPTTVSYQEDAGAVHVAIIGARHLDEVIGELQPTFEMNEKLALSSSIPVSLSYYNDAVSSFKASLRIALPTLSSNSTEAPGDTSGLTPESADHPALGAGKVPEQSLGTEALSQYQVAKTLFQEIKLLNRSLKDSPRPRGFEPYVITMQVSLMPFKRGLRYDAYSTFSFFPADAQATGIPPAILSETRLLMRNMENGAISNRAQFTKELASLETAYRSEREPWNIPDDGGGIHATAEDGASYQTQTPFSELLKASRDSKWDFESNKWSSLGKIQAFVDRASTPEGTNYYQQPIVVPLLATDNLEAEDDNRILNQIRQLNLTLAGMIHGIGAQLGADWFKQNVESLEGRDLNGLMTIGRLNDSTLRVRLGAMLQAKSEFAMVPRTHTVAVILLVPKGCRDVSLYARTAFRDTVTGKELRQRSDRMVQDRFNQIVEHYDRKARIPLLEIQSILDAITRNDFLGFSRAVEGFTNRYGTPYLKPFKQSLWVELSEIYVGGQFGTARIFLPEVPTIKLPQETNQTLLAVDDGTATTIIVKGGHFPKTDKIVATLTNYSAIATDSIPADTVTALAGGSGVQLKFPSLVSANILAKAEKPDKAPIKNLWLNLALLNSEGAGNEASVRFDTVRLVPKTEEKPTPPFQVKSTEGYLATGDGITHRYGLILKKSKDATNEFFIRVDGPMIKSVTGNAVNSASPRDTDGTIKLQNDGELVFEFDYLLPNTDVAFVLLKKGDKGDKTVVGTIKEEHVIYIPENRQSKAKAKSSD